MKTRREIHIFSGAFFVFSQFLFRQKNLSITDLFYLFIATSSGGRILSITYITQLQFSSDNAGTFVQNSAASRNDVNRSGIGPLGDDSLHQLDDHGSSIVQVEEGVLPIQGGHHAA
jgi:hypothetical protein